MNKKMMNKWIFGAALLLFAACTQDELTEQGDTLPEGVYPLEISSVTLEAEVSTQPWGADGPQTRVSENNPDRNSSKWDGDETIYVQLDNTDEIGEFKINKIDENITVTPANTVYWTKRTDDVTAWYTSPEYDNGNGIINLADQSQGLAYVLQATAEKASFDRPVSLTFTHQLAKIRVKLEGEKAGSVTDVKIESYTSCTNTNGEVKGNEASVSKITMYKVDEKTYEANVAPGRDITRFKVNGGEWVNLSKTVTPVAGNYHEITINAESKDFTVTGDYTIEGEHKPIIITGSYTVRFKDARITSDDRPVIKINDGCTPTLVFEGENALKGNITSGQDDEYSIKLENGAKLAVISEGTPIGSTYYRIKLKISGNGEMWVQSNGHDSPAIIVKNGSLDVSGGVDLTAVATNISWGNIGNLDYVPAIGRAIYVSNVTGGEITLSNCTLKLYAWAKGDKEPQNWVSLENGTVTPDVDSALKDAAWDTEVSLSNNVKAKKLKERPSLPDWVK